MTRPEESHVLNVAVFIIGFLLFSLLFADIYVLAIPVAAIFGGLFVAAVNHGRPVRLFLTDDPGRWVNGTEWRRYVVVGQEEQADGRFVVFGRREW